MPALPPDKTRRRCSCCCSCTSCCCCRCCRWESGGVTTMPGDTERPPPIPRLTSQPPSTKTGLGTRPTPPTPPPVVPVTPAMLPLPRFILPPLLAKRGQQDGQAACAAWFISSWKYRKKTSSVTWREKFVKNKNSTSSALISLQGTPPTLA